MNEITFIFGQRKRAWYNFVKNILAGEMTTECTCIAMLFK